ncbi:MAG: hypothetical protein JWL86_7048 [Rhizobium sp.]|nr:hypothetical protein [Rhizobium sp.]
MWPTSCASEISIASGVRRTSRSSSVAMLITERARFMLLPEKPAPRSAPNSTRNGGSWESQLSRSAFAGATNSSSRQFLEVNHRACSFVVTIA